MEFIGHISFHRENDLIHVRGVGQITPKEASVIAQLLSIITTKLIETARNNEAEKILSKLITSMKRFYKILL